MGKASRNSILTMQVRKCGQESNVFLKLSLHISIGIRANLRVTFCIEYICVNNVVDDNKIGNGCVYTVNTGGLTYKPLIYLVVYSSCMVTTGAM